MVMRRMARKKPGRNATPTPSMTSDVSLDDEASTSSGASSTTASSRLSARLGQRRGAAAPNEHDAKLHTSTLKLQRAVRRGLARKKLWDASRHFTARRYRGPAPKDLATIQWETAAFFTYESEIDGRPVGPDEKPPRYTEMMVGMARLGSEKGIARVQYKTFDMSAKAGKNYVAVPPTWVEFQDGETIKDIAIKVIPSTTFAGTLEFGMYINEDNPENAKVGKFLHTATIKIIDQDVFPDESLRDSVTGGSMEKIEEISPGLLIYHFVGLCFKVTFAGSVKLVLANQYHNLKAILDIFVLLLVTETLTSTKPDATKIAELVLLAMLWGLPFLGVHFLSYRRQFWGVIGGVRKNLQTLLLKKFLNYNEDSRSKVPIEQLVMSMVRDVVDATVEGYVVVLDLFSGALLKILYLILAMVYLQTRSGNGINVVPLLAVLVLPILIMAFLLNRQEQVFELRSKEFVTENNAISYVIKCVLNYQLVADYDRRTFEVQNYAEVFDTFKKAATIFNACTTNSKFFAPWLTTLLVSAWIIYGGKQVVKSDDPAQLASFLSTIALFRSIGGEFEKAYGLSLRVTAAYASIVQVTAFLNLPVDVPKRLKVTRQRRKVGRSLRAKERLGIEQGLLPKLDPMTEVPVDRLPIMMENVSFHYEVPPHPSEEGGQETDEDEIRRTTDGENYKKLPVGGDLALNASARNVLDISAQSVDAKFGRPNGQPDAIPPEPGVDNISVELTQGKLVAIVGPPSMGKATILRLLAGQLFPTPSKHATSLPAPPPSSSVQARGARSGSVDRDPSELPRPENTTACDAKASKAEAEENDNTTLFMPPHLRVVQIQETPMILGPEESIFDNLRYGIKKSPATDWEEIEERSRNIMKRLGFRETLLKYHFKENQFVGVGGARLTRADRQLISIGRALVMSPEVIIAHKPTSILDKFQTENVIDMFREFVENRGLFAPDTEPLVTRRKRTIIFTAKTVNVACRAHQIFRVADQKLEKINTNGMDEATRTKTIRDNFDDFEPSSFDERLVPPPAVPKVKQNELLKTNPADKKKGEGSKESVSELELRS